ncbi:hypothetical protein M422DRAFT_52965 [Sphaerobolus stellatus SS14]|uniref:CxC2-like cysteine cluster KDZ transposase-associated domain-containing protein n=1 Tax=Sphaerobolus stellatus (strain SS14) TaxID=990650 RepID=A0A0C9V456_SPHS4|nr:hypothetical protein M422DRAFT_52965 [Sphaerobolus stellatus SS14]
MARKRKGPHIDEIDSGRLGKIAVENFEYNTARKQPRTQATSYVPQPAVPELPPLEFQSGSQLKDKHMLLSQMMKDFTDKKEFFINEILRQEYDIRIGQACPGCSSGCSSGNPALYRCQECCNGPMLCAECLKESHCLLPFHHIEKWNRDFFQRIPLSELGHQIMLGHNGHVCPGASTSDIKKLVITYINGVHKVQIIYCRCAGAGSHVKQLLQARFFPATLIEPRSAFTFSLLHHFHKMSNEAGSAAYGYVETLQLLTNDVAMDGVPERYQEFLNIIRFWIHLQVEKRSGKPLGIISRIPKSHHNSVAVLCPACPQPTINMAPNWEEEAEDKRHKHTLFLNVDGNFRLSQKAKKDDPNDTSLANGQAYFVEDTAYAEFLAEVAEDLIEDACTCSGFKAGDILRSARGKGTVVPGLVCDSCSQHMILRPKGSVDLQIGERFCNVDYALAHAIEDTVNEHLWITLSYDVGCQYCINLSKRMTAHFPEISKLMDRFTVLVPKMHIKAHKDACQPFYSLNLTSHTGQTDGEGGERIWHELNQFSNSTREMNHGSRHDALNDRMGDFNVRKMHEITEFLTSKYKKAIEEREEVIQEFNNITSATPDNYITAWKGLDTKLVLQKDVLAQEQMRSEIKKEMIGKGSHSKTGTSNLVDFLMEGLEISELQCDVKAQQEDFDESPTMTNEKHLTQMRENLRR